MKKTYVLDTNVLLNDPYAMKAFAKNEVVIPLVVLEELDRFKKDGGAKGKNARVVNRTLDGFRAGGSLLKGVKLDNGGILKVEVNCKFVPTNLDSTVIDNRIIGVAVSLGKKKKNVVMVSRDINMRIKCDSLGVASEDYTDSNDLSSKDEIYSGCIEVVVDDKIIDDFYAGKSATAPVGMLPNQFVLLRSNSTNKTALARYYADGSLKKLTNYKEIWGITPKNKEQRFALELLMDPKVQLVSLIGLAGCGKTLLAIAAALQQIVEDKQYTRLIVARPIQPLGNDIGFLPGSIEEKLSPWLAPINDNLEYLFANDMSTLELLREREIIQAEALTYIRGRSIPKAFLIIDECQNIGGHELKTILTRVGEGTKIVLTGDIEQIDAEHLDAMNNALTIGIEKFKDYAIAGHITLKSGVRSELATLAAKIL